MKSLKSYAKTSPLMEISITTGGETYTFNLHKELKISEDTIGDDLITHPQSYGLLTMLHKELIKRAKEAKLRLESTTGKLWKMYRKKLQEGARVPGKDIIDKHIDSNSKYIQAKQSLIDLEHHRDIIESCVKAYEARKDLIQTISANRRKEI